VNSAEIKAQIRASIALKEAVLADEELLGQVHQLALACLASLRAGGKIIFAGNGGSFADAQHLSAEFTSRFLFDRAPLASLALATNNSAMSAIGNDYGYEQIFARELQAIARPGDVFIAISTTGQSGGKLRQMCECIRSPSSETARIQECHILLGHIVCGLVEAAYFQHPETAGESGET
jgi:D-sedoheptulose 7-phosphate isomerase